MNPSICAGSKPPYGWATYRTGTPRSGKMSRDMRSSARRPTNATATTIVKSEIGRRNANDTKFIVPPQPAAAPGRPNAPGRRQRSYRDISEKCGSYFRPYAQYPRFKTSSDEQNLDGEPAWDGRESAGPDDRGHNSARSPREWSN